MIFFGRLIFSKILELAVSLWVLMTVSFMLLKILPGGPFQDDTSLHPLVRETLQNQWGLEQSSLTQYFSYLKSILTGGWGVSMIRPDFSVPQIIATGFSQTFSVSILSLFFVLVVGISLTLLALSRRGTWVELLVDQLALVCVSLPSLFLGPFLIFFFGFYLDLLPIAFLQSPWHYVLPVLTLSFRPLGSTIRLLKKSMEENSKQDYIKTAYAKGLSPLFILVQHVLRNSLIPFLAYLGPLAAGLLSGSFLVEILFSIPGLGSEFVQALNERDYTVILGMTLFYGIILIFANALCDILMKWADPRMRGPA